MKKIARLITENKKIALICLFLLIVFVGCSTVSAIHVAQQRAAEAQTQEEAEAAKTEAVITSEEDDVELTSSQKALIENYDDATKEFIETLSASVWVANGGNDTLKFGGEQYTETVNGNAEKHSYAISRFEQHVDTAGLETNTVVFETDNGTHIVTYTNDMGTTGDVDAAVTSTLTSSTMFSLEDTVYERADSVEDISIKGLNSDITSLIGDDVSALTTNLSRWCAVHYPSVTEATWTQDAYISWQDSTISLTFNLNTDSGATVTAEYDMGTGEWGFNY